MNNSINPFQAKGFIGLVVNFYPLLEDMTRRGIPMNVTSLEKLDAEIDVEVAGLVKKLDEIVPNELKGFHPKEGYKRTPKEVKDAMEEWQQAQNPMKYWEEECTDCNGKGVLLGDSVDFKIAIVTALQTCTTCEGKKYIEHIYIETDRAKQARLSTLEDWIYECTKNEDGVGLVSRSFGDGGMIDCGMCKGTGIELRQAPATKYHFDNNISPEVGEYTCLHCQGLKQVQDEVKRYCRILPFNPNSSQQVSKLIKHYSDDKLAKQIVAKLHKDELDGDESEGETASPTNKVVLRKLGERTGREVYKLIVEYRELTKMQGTFIKSWTPKEVENVKCENRYCDGGIVHGGDSQGLYQAKCQVCDGKGSKDIGRVHPQFSMRPATGQLNSYSPNAQQLPKHYELAKRFRNCIEAYPNHTLLEADLSGYHALMMGFLAKDTDYIRLVRIDIHSYITGWIMKHSAALCPKCLEVYEELDKYESQGCGKCDGICIGVVMQNCLELEDKQLKAYLTSIKKKYETQEYNFVRTKKAKPILLGRQLGLSVYGAFERYKDDFMPSVEDTAFTFRHIKKALVECFGKQINLTDERVKQMIKVAFPDDMGKIQERREKLGREEVKKIYNIFDTIFPKPVQWQKAILKQANEDGYLKSAYGFIRRFWNVEEPTFDRFGNFTGSRRGEQAEQALAQLIQNSAFGHMRQIMLKLNQPMDEEVEINHRKDEQDIGKYLQETTDKLKELGLLDKYRLINTIHDSLVFECPNEYLDECIREVSRVMQMPSELLRNETMEGGFSAMVEVMVGKRFGDLKEVKI